MPQIKKEELSLNDNIKFDTKGGAILGVLEGPVADFIHPTRNKRMYTEELWDKVLRNPLVQEQFKNGGIVGELDHPADRDDICTEKVAIIMPEPPIKKNGQYYGKFNILDTPCGRIVYTLAKAGFKLGVSSRGVGDVYSTYDRESGEELEEVDPDSYEFTCFDVVLLPAVETARMKLVTESLDNKKSSYKKLLKEAIEEYPTEDGKKLMKETLNNLNINLDESINDQEQECVICHKKYKGYGNNAQPVANGYCCDECNTTVVIPARVEKFQGKDVTNKDDVREDLEVVEKEEDVKEVTPVGDSITDIISTLEENPESTIDELDTDENADESVVCINTEKCNDKINELLHAFLDEVGLELQGDDNEEDRFKELFYNIFELKEDEEESPEVTEDSTDIDVVEDNETEELLEQVQSLLKENKGLKESVVQLQKEKAVSGAKVSKLNEELNTFKSIASNAGKKVLETKDLKENYSKLSATNNSLVTDNKELRTALDQLNKQVKQLKESIKKSDTIVTDKDAEIKRLSEKLTKVETEANQKLTKVTNTLNDQKKLTEKYNKLAHNVANRYINSKALNLGITANEIKNRLGESYTLDDVDKICEELENYTLNISKLPFVFEDSADTKRVRVREDRQRDPLRGVDSQYDDTVDDYLLELAGSYSKNK